MYQTGGTIKGTIDLVQRHEYVLPAIQREFVWKHEQIERLFDSIMQGYPFGTFLLWKVKEENAALYRFYDFVREYHQKDNPHCPPLPVQNRAVTAVLDGQQRLTALNIGLCGSMAVKEPHKWWNNPNAFPVRYLYLDLLGSSEPNEEGEKYRFEFLTEKQLTQADAATTCWFKVGDFLAMESGPSMLRWLTPRLEKAQLDRAYTVLDRLHEVIHKDHVVAYYEEKTQDLSTVLNIFIRMNSGGTVLSYSDLLLSIAVAQWQKRDARKEIHSLVDDLNEQGEQFAFSQDLVLKAGLVLTDIGNVGFKVENFNRENMALLEDGWADVRRSLLLAVRLIASFGFNGQNLRANSALLPIAYYLHRLDPGDGYLTTAKYAQDRKRIQQWLTKSILKASGIWGSGLDTLLTLLRETIQKHGQDAFPVGPLEASMARRGKALSFEDEEIEELVELRYGDSRTFALLSLLFPYVDLNNQFHVDHIFPRSRFTKSKLRKAGLSEDEVDRYLTMRDGLPNLQLLDGAVNIEKRAKLPAEWLPEIYPDSESRASYRDKHLMGDLPDDITGFAAFYERRKALMHKRIAELLQKQAGDASDGVHSTPDSKGRLS